MRAHRIVRPSLLAQKRVFSSTARRLESYGFIGLGQMGYQMAKNLRSKLPPSDSIRLFDINKDAVHRLAEEMRTSQAGGASIELAQDAHEAAREAKPAPRSPCLPLASAWIRLSLTGACQDTVITVLPEPSHVKGVYAEIITPDLPRKDRIYIDCSTIDPSSSREVAKLISAAKQGQFVDAPMSGGVVGAAAGSLTFMLGAPVELVPKIEPILLRMGKRVLHCGIQGTGLSAKLANNYLLAINNIATAEAMNLGIRWGLEPKTLANILNVSTGKCWPSEVNNPVKGVVETAPANRDYSGGFGIGLMKKDLKLAIIAANEAGARLELGSRAREVYEEAEKDERCKGRDFSVVYRFIGGKE
ncbi:putative 3-hydroxyisobutyrate dehydrogenase G6G8.5 [Biscogniauxia mediterranea]|nr:putative 3-hydroxyisobutyrate dehydrogenase G6G8.5 [Biscogniauxia mediterranea]